MTDTMHPDIDDDTGEAAPTPDQLRALIVAASAVPTGHNLTIHQATFSLDVFASHLRAMASVGDVEREADGCSLRAVLAVGSVRYSVAYLGAVATIEETVVRSRAVWPDEVSA